MANEEKAAIASERDSVVLAATLLSDRNDVLVAELTAAREEAAAAARAWDAERAADEAERTEAAADAARDREHAVRAADEAREHCARRVEEAEGRIVAAAEKSRVELDELRATAAAAAARAGEEHAAVLAARDAEAAARLAEVERRRARGDEERVAELAAKDASVAAQLDEMEQRLAQSDKDHAAELAAQSAAAADQLAAAHQRAEGDLAALREDSARRLNEAAAAARAEAAQQAEAAQAQEQEFGRKLAEQEQAYVALVERMTAEAEAARVQAGDELADERARHARDVVAIEGRADEAMAEERARRMRAKAAADEKAAADRRERQELEGRLAALGESAGEKEQGLRGEIRLLRTESARLEKDVLSWEEHFDQRSYCNATMIKEDSQRFVMDTWGSVRRGLDDGHQRLARGLSAHMERAHAVSCHVRDRVATELLPAMEREGRVARERAITVGHKAYVVVAALYATHLAAVVDEHLVPVYDQHILPAYVAHVAPTVATIRGVAAQLGGRVQEEARQARSGTAQRVEVAAAAALGVLKEHRTTGTALKWLTMWLDWSAKNGEQVVDASCLGLLIFGVMLCRALLLWLAWSLLSLPFRTAWFFCPLRLCMGGGDPSTPRAAEKRNGVKETDVLKNKKKSGKSVGPASNSNGKAKVR